MIAFTLIAFFSELLGTLSGFGASAFFLPAAVFLGGFHLALGLTGALHTFSNLTKIWIFRGGISIKAILPLATLAVLFTALGAQLSSWVDPKWGELALGVLLMVLPFLGYLFTRWSPSDGHRKIWARALLALSGFTTGALGSGGAIRGSALSLLRLNPKDFVFASACIDLFGDFFRTAIYFRSGFFELADLKILPALFAAAFLGIYLGKKLLKLMTPEQFQGFVQAVIFLSGVALVFKFHFT